jgi:hypothetical protein
MNKLLIIAGLLGAVVLFLLSIYKEGEKIGSIIETVKQQKIEIKVQDEVIQERKQVIKRKVIAKSVSTNVNLDWLRSNRCKDCKGR